MSTWHNYAALCSIRLFGLLFNHPIQVINQLLICWLDLKMLRCDGKPGKVGKGQIGEGEAHGTMNSFKQSRVAGWDGCFQIKFEFVCDIMDCVTIFAFD